MSDITPRADELRSARPVADALLGGVCEGLHRQLGWSVLALRLLFIVAASARLVGVPIYLVLWLAMPAQRTRRQAPGLDAATRAGLRTTNSQQFLMDTGFRLALAVLGVGLLWFVQVLGWGLELRYLVPALLASAGVGVIWWQADHATLRSWSADGEPQPTHRSGLGRKNTGLPVGAEVVESATWLRRVLRFFGTQWLTVLLVAVGLALLGGAAWRLTEALAISSTSWWLILVGLSTASVILAVLPWVIRFRRQLADARADQMVAAARADMAAHLHDSVLQTLALIQRRADDPRAVAAFARRQERELRAYLYGEPAQEASLASALTAEAADVEAIHGVPIDVVTVGDAVMTDQVEALVRAAREAMVNAATHSGASRIDVYAEADDDLLVFVRDRGKGFDLAAIDADRAGVRGSIVERMERAGGRAIVRTAPGEGTEIRMEISR